MYFTSQRAEEIKAYIDKVVEKGGCRVLDFFVPSILSGQEDAQRQPQLFFTVVAGNRSCTS